MPPALRLLLPILMVLCVSLPARSFAAVQMAPIADEDEPAAAAPAAPSVPAPPAPDVMAPAAPKAEAPKAEIPKSEVTGSINPKTATSDDDLMCAHAPAGSVAPVPVPFKFWMLVVCAPQAQALVPVEGMVWFAHNTKEPVSVLALPPGMAAIPRTPDYNPSYKVRFKDIYATEVKGDKRTRALSLLATAQTPKSKVIDVKAVERVYQLDAVSSIYDMRYNIYFYVSDKLPRAGLICIDGCRQMLLVDVLNDDEAQARLDKP